MLLIVLVFCVVSFFYFVLILFVFVLCLVCPILPVSLDCLFLIALAAIVLSMFMLSFLPARVYYIKFVFLLLYCISVLSLEVQLSERIDMYFKRKLKDLYILVLKICFSHFQLCSKKCGSG